MSSQERIGEQRRKWDLEKYAKLANDSDKRDAIKSDDPPVKRELLRPRGYKVNLDSRLGKSQLITQTTHGSQQGGYYCEVCDCVVKDSISYLDHINGSKHQKMLGMSMKVERSTLDQVKEMFVKHKKKKEEEANAYNLEERMKEVKEEKEKRRDHKKELKLEMKRKALDDEYEGNDEMSELMGFSSFGSNKKAKK